MKAAHAGTTESESRVKEAQAKASVLNEALPYIRRWSGKTVVMKIGGETLDERDRLDSFASDVVLLRFVGMNPVVVHGGGPQISARMREAGIEPKFSGGHRVTDAPTMKIVKEVLLNEVNAEIVAAMRAHGANASPVSGEEALVVTKRLGPEGEDLGFVGDVAEVKTKVLTEVLDHEEIPVVAPMGTTEAGPGDTYNVNADLAAGAIAAALAAQKIVFLTNVPGLYGDLGDEGSLVPEASIDTLEKMLSNGSASAGMIPKIKSLTVALRAGVSQAHILDGRVRHALLLEIFTDAGIGTMVTR